MSDNTPDDGFVHISEHSVGPEHSLRLRARIRQSVLGSSYEFRVQGPRRQSCTWIAPASYFGGASRNDYVDAIRRLVASPCHPDLHHDLVAEAAALPGTELVAVGPRSQRLWVDAGRVWLADDGLIGGWDYPAKDRALLDDPHYVECAAVVAARLNEGEAVPPCRFAKHGMVLSEQWRTGKFSGDRWITSSLVPLSEGWAASVGFYPEHERGEHCYRFKLNGPEPGMAAEWLAPFGGVNGGEARHYLALARKRIMDRRPVTHENLRQELDAFGESVQSAAAEAPADDGRLAALRTGVRAGFMEGTRCATRPAEGTVATMTDAKADSAQAEIEAMRKKIVEAMTRKAPEEIERIKEKLSRLGTVSPSAPTVSGYYVFPTTGVPTIDLSRWRGFGVNVETPDDDFVRLVCGRYLVGFREHGGKVELGAARIKTDGSLGEVQPFTTIPNDPQLQKLWRRIRDGRGARHGQPDAVNAALDMIEALTGVDCHVAWTGDKVLGRILPKSLDRDSVDDWSPEQHRGRAQAVRDTAEGRGRVVEHDGVLLSTGSAAAHGVGAVGVRGAECQISYLHFVPCVRCMSGVRRELAEFTADGGERDPFLIGAEIVRGDGDGLMLLGEVVPEVDGAAVNADIYTRTEDRWPLAHAIRALAQRNGLRVGLPVPPYCVTLPRDDGTAEEMKFSDGRFGHVAHVEVSPCNVRESAGVAQLYARHGPSSDQLHVEIEHGAAIAAAYQLGRVATATIDAAVTKHLGRKALALSAFLRTPVGEGLVMAGAGMALRWLPGSSRAVRVVRDAVAPKMRQLALAEGADGIADALSGAVMRFVDSSPRDLGIGAIVEAAVPEAERAAIRIAALAGDAGDDEWPQESVQESCAASRGR